MTDKAPKKPRRRRADSKEAAVEDMLHAERVITPPSDYSLTPAERVIFNEITEELPKGEWTDHMIRIAADLTRMIADARAEVDAIRREGSVVTGASGGPIRNPRVSDHARKVRRDTDHVAGGVALGHRTGARSQRAASA